MLERTSLSERTWYRILLECLVDTTLPVINEDWTENVQVHVNTVGPLLSGHPWDFENWPLNRGWPFNRGIEYCSLETPK